MEDSKIIDLLARDRLDKAISKLYKHRKPVQKFILNNNGSREDSEDVFQDSIVILFKKVREGGFELSSGLGTYLFAVARNLWMKELRRRGKEVIWDQESTDNNDVEARNLNAEKALMLLGEKCRQLLELFYIRRWDFKRIAEKLDLRNFKVAKNQKYRCLQKARDHYQSLTQTS